MSLNSKFIIQLNEINANHLDNCGSSCRYSLVYFHFPIYSILFYICS